MWETSMWDITNEVSIDRSLGNIKDFIAKYSTTTAIIITAGSLEANRKIYQLTSDTTHNMTSLASAFDFHYIYIDDSASIAPTAVFIDSITEPSYSGTKLGWYNGDDRCIGVVASTDGAATIEYFSTSCDGNGCVYTKYGATKLPIMASNMNPSGIWQTPDNNESSVITPVIASVLYFRARYSRAGLTASFYAASSEMAAINTAVGTGEVSIKGYNDTTSMLELNLGASRNIKIAGDNADNNTLTVYPVGFKIVR